MLQAEARGLGRLEAVELWRGEVRLREPLGAAHGVHDVLEKLYVRICCADAEGWGEVAAIPEPVGIDPSLRAVEQLLVEDWPARLETAALAREGRCPESQTVALFAGSSVLEQVAAAVIEMAVLDAELRADERSLADQLGTDRSAVRYGGLVGIPESHRVPDALERAAELVEGGASRLRVKISPTFGIDALRAIAAAFPGLALHADANGSFDPSSVEILRPLDDLSLVCIEQPLATRDLAALAQVASSFQTPICLDETITSRRVARDVLRYGACRALCVKPARVGGLRAARAIVVEAAEFGAASFVGGMFETGLGRAYLGALAAGAEVALISDVAAPATYLLEDPCSLEGPRDGLQPLHRTPGVGPWPARARLERVAVRCL
jgi:O-succinylbenzoate synthase